MGQRNRTNRAAKQRKRAQSDHRRQQAGFDAPPPNTDDLAAGLVFAAVRACATGTPAEHCLPAGVDAVAAIPRAADLLALEAVSAIVTDRWTPTDLDEIARRRLDTVSTNYLLDVLAAVTDRDARLRTDPSWTQQLAASGAGPRWWQPGKSHLLQWAARHGLDTRGALVAAIEALALLFRLGPMPRSAAGSAAPVEVAEQRMLTKVRSLLSKAESTEFDEEAEALTAKAQELMSRYAIDHAMLADADQTPAAVVRRIWLDTPYLRAKGTLVSAVATANRCEAVLSEEIGFVSLVGQESDLRLVTLLSTSLLVQATRAMAASGSHATRSGVSRTRSFRQSFLVAYAGRIGERLREATSAAEAAADRTRLLPVLAARSRVVDDAMREHFPRLVDRSVAITNEAGWGAGRAAADLARFDIHDAVDRGQTG